MKENIVENKLYTLPQAATLLGVTPGTLLLWGKKGQITFVYTPGGHRRVEPSEVERLLENRQPKQVSERSWR